LLPYLSQNNLPVIPKAYFPFLQLITAIAVFSQDDVSYKLPSKEFADIQPAKPAPGVSIVNKGHWMLLLKTYSYLFVEELARPEPKIKGLRINPSNFSSQPSKFYPRLIPEKFQQRKPTGGTGRPALS
jgi:hypothetical protein